MWLINTEALTLKFFPNPPDRYAILSHVWTDEECSFEEFQALDGTKSAATTSKKGYKKIEACCKLASSQGFTWVWIDTCCIDKKSSAELSESINSMFAWYKASTVCFAYLEDVESTSSTCIPPERWWWMADTHSDGLEYRASRWYTRGWTLQELLAPTNVDFYNRSWTKIGSKWRLRQEISAITGIGEEHLAYFNRGRSSIAQKMSWASRRRTTRVEDEAYSLLGIFGVFMPLLYGEGRNAFRRLQEELIRTSNDQTIFAWSGYVPSDFCGMIALTTSCFRHSGSIVSCSWPVTLPPTVTPSSPPDVAEHPPRVSSGAYSMTNAGLVIELPMLHVPISDTSFFEQRVDVSSNPSYFCLLNCRDNSSPGRRAVGVVLQHVPGSKLENAMKRVLHTNTVSMDMHSGGLFKGDVYGQDNKDLAYYGNFLSTRAVIFPDRLRLPVMSGGSGSSQLRAPYRARICLASHFTSHPTHHDLGVDDNASGTDGTGSPTILEITDDGWYFLELDLLDRPAKLILSFDTNIITITFSREEWFSGRSTICARVSVGNVISPSEEVSTAEGVFSDVESSSVYRRQLANEGVWFEHRLCNRTSLVANVFKLPSTVETITEGLYFEVKEDK
ncbi:heterokaryon incompatibility protein-domain-containing protein [Echria macrotheca]|uniref:Heterokaryon incompatibility protein-domain-containing protein n=1 Tax=Echria macrotheca TaxID=438768 RepID=A0AAJ0B3N0_9PEZI|nr:heterokaryon incompatibility protein-domain-containing protein [Echria macrotheca]